MFIGPRAPGPNGLGLGLACWARALVGPDPDLKPGSPGRCSALPPVACRRRSSSSGLFRLGDSFPAIWACGPGLGRLGSGSGAQAQVPKQRDLGAQCPCRQADLEALSASALLAAVGMWEPLSYRPSSGSLCLDFRARGVGSGSVGPGLGAWVQARRRRGLGPNANSRRARRGLLS